RHRWQGLGWLCSQGGENRAKLVAEAFRREAPLPSRGFATMDRKRAVVIGGAVILATAGFALVWTGRGDEAAGQAAATNTAIRDVGTPANGEDFPEETPVSLAPPGLDGARPTECLIEPSQV